MTGAEVLNPPDLSGDNPRRATHMPIDLIHPVVALTFFAVCAMATEILIQSRKTKN